MATLVLTVVGTAIGGPLGGAIGATLGQAIDARLFAPAGRKGPRLTDLKLQTSSYGTPVPQIFGTMRVAGTVIWATDLVEKRHRQSRGKGQPRDTTYSYSASFAVALSSRPIGRIGRIWAEGNLLRGAAGDFKTRTGFRWHDGSEDQPADPLIAAAEGIANCPAYRGLAYAVFEDMELADYGNRIPSLSFEIIADEGEFDIGVPIGAMLGDWEAAGPGTAIAGYALSGASRAEAVAPLLRLTTLDRMPGSSRWRIGSDAGDTVTSLGEPAADDGRARIERRSAAAASVPSQIAIAHYDPARDHQVGVQQARVAAAQRQGPLSRIELPAALGAGAAKALAARLAGETLGDMRSVMWPAGFAALAVPPGARVTGAPGDPFMRVEERRIEGATVRLTLREDRPGVTASPVAADSGRSAGAMDRAIGDSVGALFDLPSFDGGAAPRLVLAVAGSEPGWRGAAIGVQPQSAAPVLPYGSAGPVAVLGTVMAVSAAAPAPLGAAMIDRAGHFDIALLRSDMTLSNVSDADLLAGGNMAAAGDEVMQFGSAVPIGGGVWRLSRLLRGRFGTEDAMAATLPGRAFTLLDDPALVAVSAGGGPGGLVPVSAGGTVEIVGVADAGPVIVPVATAGRAARPLSPVHLAVRWQTDGGLALSWVRRSRAGFAWPDGLDAPLDERDESYRVDLSTGSVTQSMIVASPVLLLSASEIATWRASGPQLSVSVAQRGAVGESIPLAALLPL